MMSNGFFALTLVDRKNEYDQVHTFRFLPNEPVPFIPGQYVHLLAPASPPGRENVRHLSIASIPEEGPLQFTVDLSSNTEYKKKLASLEPGGQAHLFKVKGDFVLPNALPAEVIFVAGGLGITPIRSLIRQIETHQLPVAWRLLHVARGAHLYESDLAASGGLQVRIQRPAVTGWLDRWTQERPRALWYISGSSRFVAGLQEQLGLRGIAPEAIRVEDFH